MTLSRLFRLGYYVTLAIIAVLVGLLIFVLIPSVAFAQGVVVNPIGLDGPITFPTEFDTDLIMWSALMSQILPVVIARIVGTTWHKDQKIGAAIVVCLLGALVTTFFLGKLDASDYITSALIVFTLTSIMYKQVWKGSEVVHNLNAK